MDCFNAGIIMMKELEGTATDRETDLLMRHMLTCGDCLSHFQFLMDTVLGNKNRRTETAVPVDFEVQVMTKIRYVNAVTIVTEKKIRKIK